MITKNAMQLKAMIKNKAKILNITPQAALQTYCLERFLERISMSDKAECFIIKGGFLISSLIGIENRSTMDIDTTAKGFEVSKKTIEEIFRQICSIQLDDQLKFIYDRIEDIREDDIYPGMRVYLKAAYESLNIPISIDVTTGDSIIPSEIRYSYHCVYDDKDIQVMAYPLENVISEKLETIISRGIANTRPRDFYDVYILYQLKGKQINWSVLREALNKTSKKRGSEKNLGEYKKILDSLKNNVNQHMYWNNYKAKNLFVKGITYEKALEIVEKCFKKIGM
ncbi:nucleotidyl transferase AbiEii/AbiGii toxin family protein [Treponema sp.]|uniref:nucleotidyl transferase AbiEii/AbiGii toxin family protein n=1 Tax=Treponema sp. TaxID=166 RepID=UPI00388E8D7E